MLATMGAAGPGRSSEGACSARALGGTIRALRNHAGLSQEALGKRAGMHQNYLGALERGEISNPGLEPLARVAHGLRVSIAVLAESYAAPAPGGVLRVDAAKWPPPSQPSRNDAVALGRAIRLVRRSRDITQEQLALKIGIHRNYVGSIEAGEKSNPGIASIERIARGLQHPAELLLPLLAQAFTGVLTPAGVDKAVAPNPSRSAARSPAPPGER